MTDRPIIFSAPMVRALLDGRKTQTRRLATSPLRRCEVGDRLWVRENFWLGPDWAAKMKPSEADGAAVCYSADETPASEGWSKEHPSIHMPRWASRLTLIVEAVRVEPLQAISAHDCYEEGVKRPTGPFLGSEVCAIENARRGYRQIWEALHDKPGQRWGDNPDVVVLTFRVERGNIDRIEA